MKTPDTLPNLPLPNIRWERFAQAVARGESQTKAYVTAGYSPNPAQASRLANNQAVKRRIAHVVHESAMALHIAVEVAAKESGITKAMVIAELWDNALSAKVVRNYAASNQALALVGREFGLFRGLPAEDEPNEPAERPGLDETAVGQIKKSILDVAS